MIMVTIFAHAGEDHGDVAETGGLLDTISHLPTVVSLILVVTVLTWLFLGLRAVRVSPPNRLLMLFPVSLAMAVFYMQHNPLVSTAILAAGFIVIFLLVFTMLASRR